MLDDSKVRKFVKAFPDGNEARIENGLENEK
jgi:hypothetical protein